MKRLETVLSLGWEEPLEEGMATDSSIHTWRIPWTEEPGELQSMGGGGHIESDTIEHTPHTANYCRCGSSLTDALVL